MTSCNLLRSFFRIQKLPRIPIAVHKSELSSSAQNYFKDALNVADCNKNFSSPRMFSSTSVSDIKKAENEKLKGPKRPKTAEVPKIMLLSETGSISAVTMEEANKIAKKRSLKLKEVENPEEIIKTDKKVFKLMSNAQFVNDKIDKPSKAALADKDKSKEFKTLMLRSNTSDNDVMSKVKNVKKWIAKGHTVKVFIGNVNEKADGEHVYDVLQEGLKDVRARIVQKVVKGSEIRFQVMPPKDAIKKDKNKDFKEETEDENEKSA